MEEKELAAAGNSCMEQQGDRWGFVAVLPDTGFIHTVHNGKRNLEEASIFLSKVKEGSNGEAPLFLSDAWFYENALYDTYCHYEPQPYKGIGRPSHPNRIIDKELKYAQVYKERDKKGNLKQITTRIIRGKEHEILKIIRKKKRSKTINTSFVESRNGKYRKDNVRLGRKTLCHSKKIEYHDAHIDFLTVNFNYCRENQSLRELQNPHAKLFETKYTKKSPAMAEGLINKVLSLKELLCFRVLKTDIL